MTARQILFWCCVSLWLTLVCVAVVATAAHAGGV